MAAYLTAALEDGDVAVVVAALGDVARAKGKRELVESAGLSAGGNPDLSTVLRVATPSLGDFATLVSRARKTAKKTRMTKQDIANAVNRVRRAR